jgi:hypothetical protein
MCRSSRRQFIYKRRNRLYWWKSTAIAWKSKTSVFLFSSIRRKTSIDFEYLLRDMDVTDGIGQKQLKRHFIVQSTNR